MPKRKRFNQKSRRNKFYQYRERSLIPTGQEPIQQQSLQTNNNHAPNTHVVHPFRPKSVVTNHDKNAECANGIFSQEMISSNHLSQKCTRIAIAYVFVEVLDIPPPQLWLGREGTIAQISRTLNISSGSTRLISNVLQNVTTSFKNGMEYTGEINVKFMRESRKIKEDSIDEELICNWMEDGLGFRLTTMFLNEHRKQEGREEVAVKSVYNTFHRMNPLITRIEKSPQKPENIELWSRARYNWVTQLLLRTDSISMETLPEDLPKEEYFDKDKLQREGKCFHWAQVAHFDEIHINQKAGMETTTGYQIGFL